MTLVLMKIIVKILLVITIVFCFAECRTPIVIVPGIGGSQIEAKLAKNSTTHYWCYQKYKDWFALWLNIEELLPLAAECWADNLKLEPDPVTGKMANTPGVHTRNPDFGGTSAIEWLDPSTHIAGVYFYPLIYSLVRVLNYTRGKDVRAAPYDFRYDPASNEKYMDKLQQLIEETYIANDNKKILLLSHSMGCPYTIYFLRRQSQVWKDKYLTAWMTISGVYGGSVKAVQAYISGDGFGIPSILDKPRYLRSFQRTFSSLAFILPDAEFWHSEEVIVRNTKRNYTVADYDALFQDMGYPHASKILKSVPRAWDENPPNIKMFCFHGTDVRTPGELTYPEGYFPDGWPRINYVDGDGTVPARSLEGCLKWRFKQKQPVNYEYFHHAEHNAILGDARLLRAVIQALQESDEENL